MLILNSTLDDHLKYYFWKKNVDTNEYPYKILEEYDWGWKILYNLDYGRLCINGESGLLFVHKSGLMMGEFEIEENEIHLDSISYFLTRGEYCDDDMSKSFLCFSEHLEDPSRNIISLNRRNGIEYDF